MTGHEAIKRIGNYLLDTSAVENTELREALKLALDCIEKRYFMEEAIEKIREEIQTDEEQQLRLLVGTNDKMLQYGHEKAREAYSIALEIIDRHINEVDE